MVNVLLPIIVDKWSPSEDIAKLRDVLAVNSLIRYESLEYAYNKPLIEQDWFYNILYASGLYPIFKIFGVPEDEIVSIKALVNYNYNPTLENLYILLDSVIPSSTDYLVDQGQGWVTITIASLNLDNYTYPINTEVSINTLEADDTLNNPLLEVPSVDFTFNYQNKYILTNYVPCGVLLSIILTTPVLLKNIKRDVVKIRKDSKKITKYYDKLIKDTKDGRC